MRPPINIDRLLEKQCWAIDFNYTFMNFRYLVDKRYRTLNPDEIVAMLKLRQEALQAIVMRWKRSGRFHTLVLSIEFFRRL